MKNIAKYLYESIVSIPILEMKGKDDLQELLTCIVLENLCNKKCNCNTEEDFFDWFNSFCKTGNKFTYTFKKKVIEPAGADYEAVERVMKNFYKSYYYQAKTFEHFLNHGGKEFKCKDNCVFLQHNIEVKNKTPFVIAIENIAKLTKVKKDLVQKADIYLIKKNKLNDLNNELNEANNSKLDDISKANKIIEIVYNYVYNGDFLPISLKLLHSFQSNAHIVNYESNSENYVNPFNTDIELVSNIMVNNGNTFRDVKDFNADLNEIDNILHSTIEIHYKYNEPEISQSRICILTLKCGQITMFQKRNGLELIDIKDNNFKQKAPDSHLGSLTGAVSKIAGKIDKLSYYELWEKVNKYFDEVLDLHFCTIGLKNGNIEYTFYKELLNRFNETIENKIKYKKINEIYKELQILCSLIEYNKKIASERGIDEKTAFNIILNILYLESKGINNTANDWVRMPYLYLGN